MTKIIYFEYCALIIEFIMLYAIWHRNLTRGRINKWYISIVITITAATAFDIIGIVLEMVGPGYTMAKYIANMLCLVFTVSTPIALCGYLFSQTGTWYRLNRRLLFKRLFYVPWLANVLLLTIINAFTHLIFYIDDKGFYARGILSSVMYILSFVYVFIGAYVVIKNGKLYTIRKMLSVFLLLFSSVFATVIQMIFPDVLVQMFFTACASLILLLEVQAPEERIQGKTGLFSMNAYVQDTKRFFDIGVEFEVIIIAINNYESLVSMLGFFKALNIINQISEKLLALTKEYKVDADHYYLDNGRFAVLLDDRYKDNPFTIAQGINKLMSEDIDLGSTKVKILANVCAVLCPKDIDDPEFLVAFDDVVASEVYSGELRYAEKIFKKRQFELKREFPRLLDRAFNEDYIYLEYQPVYSVEERRYKSAEAFLRFNDPEFGNIAPDVVIAEAERSNTIHAITAFVIDEVCKFISHPNFLLTGLTCIEINMSPIQCMWDDLLSVILSTIRSYDVQPKNICFNITDIDSYEMYAGMKENLEALEQVGFKLVMDDFGAGVFEIERIAALPLAGIKLDRMFVKDGLNKANFSILKGTVRMIRDLGITAAAIGIEDDEMDAVIRDLGCTMLQGYHYSKPLSSLDLLGFLLMQ